MSITVGIISVVFALLGIGLIHLEVNEVKENGLGFASTGFIFFGVLWTIGWIAMALGNLNGSGENTIEIFGFIIAN
ncbi:MAG: hypothetical protein GKR92_02590 [Gammaproteobacteria bacterium]|nr:MAG: hypothetical protein GKR92_02590 [Gammaproteobacteria bacterium]